MVGDAGMALYYDLPVFKDVYKLTLRLFEVTSNFPREYKFTLGQDMKRDSILLVRHIYRANKVREKTVYLEQFLVRPSQRQEPVHRKKELRASHRQPDKPSICEFLSFFSRPFC